MNTSIPRSQSIHEAPIEAPTEAPFGSWVSPITTDLIVGETIRLVHPEIGDDGIFWIEGRPAEQGRNVIVRYAGADATPAARDVTPAPFNVRTLVHEYGGGAYATGPRTIWFSHFNDQQIYRIALDGINDSAPQAASNAGDVRSSEPVQLTQTPGMRFADAVADLTHGRLIAVAEDHRAGDHEPVNSLVAIDLESGAVRTIAGGHDFFSSPVIRADGRQLAWLSWDHPNMPWDGTTLWLADLADDGSVGTPQRVAGGTDESIFQPAWSPSGELHFVSDRSGWWNLYRVRNGDVEALHAMPAEFGTPQWLFAMRTYGFDSQGRVIAVYEQDGESHLAMIGAGAGAGTFETIATPYRAIRDIRVHGDQAIFIGSSPTDNEAIVLFDLSTRTSRVLREASRTRPDPAFVSVAEAIRFPTEGGRDAHALFYPPVNAQFKGPSDALPPLLVFSHGGPTSSTNAGFKWSIQYWTSRGFAVVDVNYGGSAGYGREYRSRLDRAWGVVDVDDCVNAARYLVAQGRVDANQVAIRGGSAGGYTTLSALTFRDFFKAGASHYGIGDLEALARDTHKFESRYLERLIGKYPEEQALYQERSPIRHTDRLSSAMILFQGAEDKAVPPNQAEAMYGAVRAKGLPVAYRLFEHEQHGFRRADTIRRVYDAELYFYGKVFGFTPAGEIEPVTIDNL